MTLTIIDPAFFPTWDDKILGFAEHSVFHTSSWAKTLVGAYQYTPLYFTIFNNQELIAALPVMEIKSVITGRRGVSLPFTDSCPVLTRNASDVEHLFQEAVRYGRNAGWKYVELRGGARFFSDSKPFCSYYDHHLDLRAGVQKIYSGLRSSTRRNIKKASREGVDIRVSGSVDALKAFCRLNTITRKKHGLPPQPDGFFQNLYEHFLAGDQGFIALALYRQQPVAAAVFLYSGKSAVFKYGASDPRFLFLRPNNLVMWEAIRYLVHKGLETVSFGRTEPENEGLLQFKRGWGAVETKISYFRFDLRRNAYVEASSAPKASYGIFRSTPEPLLRVLGTLLYRHVG